LYRVEALVYPTLIMPAKTDLHSARSILGKQLVGPEEVVAAFGSAAPAAAAEAVPFSVADLEAARDNGEFLILRTSHAGAEPLTLLWLIRRFAGAFDAAFLRKTGYQLKNDWGIEIEPLAAQDTCAPGWALVKRDVLPSTLNLNHAEQEEEIRQYAARRAAAGRTRRRTAVEAAYDTLAVHHATGERLLARSWDWTSSRTVDGGLLNVGHFDERGMQILSFSFGVRHGQLGVCPNIDPE